MCLNNFSFSDLKLDINKSKLTALISNGVISVKFDKSLVTFLSINGKNIVENLNGKKTFVLDWDGGKKYFIPNDIFVVNYSSSIAHIYFQQIYEDSLEIEYHFLMKKFISGIYSYVKIKNSNNTNFVFSELRTVYRFDNSLMNRLNNSIVDIKSYLYSYLNKKPLIQDETWQLDDGNYYSKYDLASYVREVDFYGVYGDNYGAWLINSTNEYYSGGPLKQDLLVHQDSLMLNYLTSTHFGTPVMKIPKYWSKMYGPWLIYFNFNTINKLNLLNDVKYFSKKEKENYPYLWLKDKDYQLDRKYLKGKINSNNNGKFNIVLSSSLKEEFDIQTLGYIYFSKTDSKGNFCIKNIRINKYNMHIYPINGYYYDLKWKKSIEINSNINMEDIDINYNKKKIIWSIGETNRKSDNFKFSNKKRNYVWHTLVPKNLNFYIGKSNCKKDWYYAQTSRGIWKIYFFDIQDDKNRFLYISIAGASNNLLEKKNFKPQLEIFINNCKLKECFYENDKSIYRGALQSGNFSHEKILISYKKIINGLNIISLNLIGGSIMYDNINLVYQ